MYKKRLLILVVFALSISIIVGCSSDKEPEKELTALEKCVQTYSVKENICKTMEEYIDDFPKLSKIEQNGTQNYKVSTTNGNEYLVPIDSTGDVAKITTAEKDYDSRTVLYEKEY